MKREILAPALAWAAGAVGFALRRWELSAALDPETLLFSPHPSTALLLGVPEGTVKSRLAKARATLKRRLETDG